jgi:RimJ/RimL family protein N-acetyltransferase
VRSVERISRREIMGWSDGANMPKEHTTPQVVLRPASMEDAELLFDWRNDPATRAASRETAPLVFAKHLGWLRRCLRDDGCKLFVVHSDSKPVGTVRAERGPAGWRISWTVAPAYRGMGYGSAMVQALVRMLAGRVHAEIRKGNDRSTRIAESAGMRFEREVDGLLHYKLDPADKLAS